MMADQKGRSGKKPKYQIADIGGPDVTSQDISTERVLNFLIKGEMGAGDPSPEAESVGHNATDSSPEQAPVKQGEEPVETPLPSSGPHGKKSLAHLFQRAGGGGGVAKDLKFDLSTKEHASVAILEQQLTKNKRVQAGVLDHQIESEAGQSTHNSQQSAANEAFPLISRPSVPTHQPDTSPRTAQTQHLTDDEPLEVVPIQSAELTQLITLWKSFYRLKDGEIEALSALYRISHGQGTPDCYIKMHNLAEVSNLTYRYCQKVVRSLELLGWITKIKGYDPSTQLGVLYRINLKPSV